MKKRKQKFQDRDETRDNVRASDPSGVPRIDVDALFSLVSTEPVNVSAEYQERVDEFVDFVGCILGIVLSERQVGWLRLHAAEALTQPDSDEANLVDSSVREFQAVKDADIHARHAWRQQNQPRFTEWIFEMEDTLSRTLREWHTEAQQVIAPGHPPLTHEAAESCIELFASAVLIVQGKDPGTAAPQNLEASIAQLATQYQSLHPQQQLWIAFAPITLYEIRRSWPTMSASQREAIQGQLAAQYQLQRPQTAAQNRRTSTSVTSPPPTGRVSAWERFRDDSSVDSLQRHWAEAQDRGDHRKAAELQLKIQIALQREAQSMAMLTNITTLRHGSMMKVADNLRS